MGWYDTAQVCLNGHVVNDSTIKYPEWNKSYCEDCGEKTITKCPKCNTPIRGYYHVEGVISTTSMDTPPRYCYQCGAAFPWTEEKLKAAKELADLLEELSEQEREDLKKSIDDLLKDGPRTEIATFKFKKIMKKLGPEIITAFKELLIDMVSETVKKSLWG